MIEQDKGLYCFILALSSHRGGSKFAVTRSKTGKKQFFFFIPACVFSLFIDYWGCFPVL